MEKKTREARDKIQDLVGSFIRPLSPGDLQLMVLMVTYRVERRGGFFVITGPAGSGKSDLARRVLGGDPCVCDSGSFSWARAGWFEEVALKSGYVFCDDMLELRPGVCEKLQRLADRGVFVVVTWNGGILPAGLRRVEHAVVTLADPASSGFSEHAGAVGEADLFAAEEARAEQGHEAFVRYLRDMGHVYPDWHELPEDLKVAFVEFANKVCRPPSLKAKPLPEWAAEVCSMDLPSAEAPEPDPRYLTIDLEDFNYIEADTGFRVGGRNSRSVKLRRVVSRVLMKGGDGRIELTGKLAKQAEAYFSGKEVTK